MSIRPSRLITTVVAFTILFPMVLFSQAKIKEKVEIKPSGQRSAPRISKTYDFYSPPLFVGDSSFTVTLNSSLIYSGTVSLSDDIGYDQSAEVGCVFHDPLNSSVIYDTSLAWKGRRSVAAGGGIFQGDRTVPLICDRGTAPPEVQLLLWHTGFDGFGQGHMTGDDRHISYNFTGSRTALDGSSLAVSGSAFISGSPLALARFSGWKIESEPYIQCRGASVMRITPLDSSGAVYSPAVGSDTLTGSFTVSVTARGNYAYLQATGQEGSQVTVGIPHWDDCDLVLDTQLGDIPGGVDTAFVTVTGGGRSATHKVILYSYGFHFDFGTIQSLQHGEIRQLRAAIRDGCSNDVDYVGTHYYKFELLGNSATWGVLRDTLTGRSGAVVDSVTSTLIEFDSWGMNPESPATVTIKVSVDDGTIDPVTASFTVLPAQMRAILGKKVLSYGDTTSLKIQIQNPDGSWMDKPAAWAGTYTIVQADTFGFLYNPDSSKVGRVIKDASPILIYYARPESGPDSVKVLIQLMLEEPPPFPFGQLNSAGNVGTQAQGVAPQPKVSGGSDKRPPAKVSGGIVFGGAIHWGDVELEEKKQNEILLGETKFYEAYIDQDNGNNLAIKELEETSEWTGPELIVDFKVDPLQGGKLGVYYESRDREGDPVVRNLIRLVGRYWEKDNPYKVKLTATYNGQIATKDIDVKKPTRLGDSPKKAMNVFNQEYDLDDLIIEHAGREGILPQYVKAIIRQEALGFLPSYRYEPFDDVEKVQGEASRIKSSSYWITDQSHSGIPAIPDHANLRDALGPIPEYPGYKHVWDIYLEKNAGPQKMYAGGSYSLLSNKFDEYYWPEKKYQLSKNKSEHDAWQIAQDSAYARRDRWLKYEYGDVGMVNIIAQTRIAASYGLMQLTYYNAIDAFPKWPDYNYPDHSSDFFPEAINVNSTGFKYQILHLKGKIRIGLERVLFDDPTWPTIGLEKAYRRGLSRYNTNPDYPDAVHQYVNDFLPLAY